MYNRLKINQENKSSMETLNYSEFEIVTLSKKKIFQIIQKTHVTGE